MFTRLREERKAAEVRALHYAKWGQICFEALHKIANSSRDPAINMLVITALAKAAVELERYKNESETRDVNDVRNLSDCAESGSVESDHT